MRKSVLMCSVALTIATPGAANAWTRGFVVDFYEPAFFYGGPGLTTEAPGTDCPNGTVPAVPTTYRLGIDGPRQPQQRDQRTFAPGIDVYLNPFTARDPGQQEVGGKIALGFNLDGNANTGGFTSPSGEKGIDNQLYRVLGCYMSYRGIPYHADLSMRANDKMLEGLYTIVVRVSGSGADPMNDNDAVVEIGYSPDKLVKDATGKIASSYSYRIAKGAQYTRLKATIKNGVVTTEQVPDLRMPDFAWYETNRGEADYQKGKLQLVMAKDGTMSGLVGGYLDWRHFYGQDAFNVPSGASNRESYFHQNEVGIYYGLKRNADGIPDPKTGKNTAISAAYRFTARPAYIVDPAQPVVIDEPTFDKTVPQDRALFTEASWTAMIVSRKANRARTSNGYDADSVSPPTAEKNVPGEIQAKVETAPTAALQ